MRPLDLLFECYILFHTNVLSFVALNSTPLWFIMKLVVFFQLGFWLVFYPLVQNELYRIGYQCSCVFIWAFRFFVVAFFSEPSPFYGGTFHMPTQDVHGELYEAQVWICIHASSTSWLYCWYASSFFLSFIFFLSLTPFLSLPMPVTKADTYIIYICKIFENLRWLWTPCTECF